MGGIQAQVPDGNVRVDSFDLPEGDDGADAVVSACIQEMDVEGEAMPRSALCE